MTLLNWVCSQELPRHFWSSYPVTTQSLVNKANIECDCKKIFQCFLFVSKESTVVLVLLMFQKAIESLRLMLMYLVVVMLVFPVVIFSKSTCCMSHNLCLKKRFIELVSNRKVRLI